jgi:phosphorylase kinase alpha/beta subunit
VFLCLCVCVFVCVCVGGECNNNSSSIKLKIFYVLENRLSILGRRRIEGSLCRVPPHFYNQVWQVLERCPGGICVYEHQIPQQPTLSNMTRSELTFALLVESILHHINIPEYRQIIVEVYTMMMMMIIIIITN